MDHLRAVTFKRTDLEHSALWQVACASLTPQSVAVWESNPLLQDFARSLLAYFTHVLPSHDPACRSLAVQCLRDGASLPSGSDSDARIKAALATAPDALSWHVYTVRRAVVSVWDPLSGPLADFLSRCVSRPFVAPAPVCEGAQADPDSFRFLMRCKLVGQCVVDELA